MSGFSLLQICRLPGKYFVAFLLRVPSGLSVCVDSVSWKEKHKSGQQDRCASSTSRIEAGLGAAAVPVF